MNILVDKTVLFIDLDGTLIKTASGKTFPEDCTDFIIRKEVLDKIAEKLGIKPKIEVRYIKPQVVKLHSRVTMSNFEMQYYCRDKFGMEQLKRIAIESVYDEILKGMNANGLVSISQYKDIYTNSTIYEGTCEIYKSK